VPRLSSSTFSSTAVTSFAEQLGEALGRGVARGLNSALSGVLKPANGAMVARRGPGRPPKALAGIAAALCKVSGCGKTARSKGLCSAHYQAERRKQRAKKAA
jgi:hypothetical protein